MKKKKVNGKIQVKNTVYTEKDQKYKTVKKDKEEKKKYGSMPMKKAWEVFKALPEQQQYQEMPGLGEGFEQATPQRRIGTVPPAIISMLRRLQSGEGPGPTRPGNRSVGYDASFTDDRPMPNLKTFHADPLQDMRGRDIPSASKLSRKYFINKNK